MTRLLVFGGTRFFGKKTVDFFIKEGYDITIATRGQTKDNFGDTVTRIDVDREDPTHPGWESLKNQAWDFVFDNICYTWESAKLSLDHLKDVGHYLVTSSLAVYEGASDDEGFRETQFDPIHYEFIPQESVSYGEGKRQVEAFFEKYAPFPVTYLRFPVVLDDDDYTERLHFYIREALAGNQIVFQQSTGHFSYIKGSEIPLALTFIIKSKVFGPINISSSGPFTLNQFISSLESAVNQSVNLLIDTKQKQSPFSYFDQAMNVSTLESLGYQVTSLVSWLPALMERITVNERTS